jgi:hypothetical protein
MRTINRPTPEGAWDHDLPYIVEDQTAVASNAIPAKPIPILAMALLYNSEKDIQMLKGWKTVIVAVGVAAVGALQTVGWADLVPPAYVGPVMLGLGFVMAYLRSQSTGPIGEKK